MPDFDDPFTPSDATVLRPRPGAGKRTGNEPPPPAGARPPVRPVAVPDAVVTAPEVAAGGLNPLVQAASPLLQLAGRLRTTLMTTPDLGGLRRHALEEIRRFEERARQTGVANEFVVAARYALCAALDEAVLSTPWGTQSEWAQQTLLVTLHREAWGGEKFFDMLDRIKKDPAKHIDLIELQYLCIALGFTGKYRVSDGGQTRLAQIQHELYQIIRAHRGVPQPDLSLRWRGHEKRRNRLIRYVPWWVVGAAALAIMAVTFAVYYARLGTTATPVYAALAKVGNETFAGTPPPATPSAGPTLKQLLANEERSGAISVEEEGARTRITLLAPDLFASASATPNQAYTALLDNIAKQLNAVPGPVLVEGHTDSQPVQSLRFHNNFELSRERAVAVAGILRQHLNNPARLQWNGVGSTQPRYPETSPENRARNRRVEIIHVRET
jgi:type VI secretion system protein ImpK